MSTHVALAEELELTPFEVEVLRVCKPSLEDWRIMRFLLGSDHARMLDVADLLWARGLVDALNRITPAGRAALAELGVST